MDLPDPIPPQTPNTLIPLLLLLLLLLVVVVVAWWLLPPADIWKTLRVATVALVAVDGLEEDGNEVQLLVLRNNTIHQNEAVIAWRRTI